MIPLLCTVYLVQIPQIPSGLSLEKWSSRAEIEMQAEDWRALNVTSQGFTKEYPTSGKAWGYLSISLMGLDSPSEAELALELGTKSEPSFPGNWYNLGLVRSQLHRPSESIKLCLDELARLNPEFALGLSRDRRIQEAISIPSDQLLDLGKLTMDDYPSKKLSHIQPYPREALIHKIQGIVWVDLIVDSTGRTISVGSPHGPQLLVKPALLSAIQTRFPIFTREGIPRAYKVTYGLPFRLR